jgi:hypothetical protein
MHFEIFIKQRTFATPRATTAPSVEKGGFERAIGRHEFLLHLVLLSSAAWQMTLGQTATRNFFEYLATENQYCRVLPIPSAKTALCI